jgi:hypothetical protein
MVLGRHSNLLSEQIAIEGRTYNLDYKEQGTRTIIAISSDTWDEQDADNIARLRELLAQDLVIKSNPRLEHMIFVHKNAPNGVLVSVPIGELKAIVKNCLARMQ